MHTLMGSHPAGFRYSVDVTRSVMARSLKHRAREGAQTTSRPRAISVPELVDGG
jgi:hypothetical protein